MTFALILIAIAAFFALLKLAWKSWKQNAAYEKQRWRTLERDMRPSSNGSVHASSGRTISRETGSQTPTPARSVTPTDTGG